jgi:hypothetical protein
VDGRAGGRTDGLTRRPEEVPGRLEEEVDDEDKADDEDEEQTRRRKEGIQRYCLK